MGINMTINTPKIVNLSLVKSVSSMFKIANKIVFHEIKHTVVLSCDIVANVHF